MEDNKQMTAKEAVHDLTLALIYLTRFIEDEKRDELRQIRDFRAWKNYDWNTIDKLDEEGLVISKHGNKSLWITEDGVVKARELLERFGISDWERNE